MWFAAAILGVIAIGFGITKLPSNPEVPPAQASAVSAPAAQSQAVTGQPMGAPAKAP
jgi:hypothetical protein